MPSIKVTPTKGLFQRGGTSTVPNGSVSGHKQVVKAVSAAASLTAADSGKVIFWDASTSNPITLPELTEDTIGINYKIILKDTVNTDDAARITVGAATDSFYGLVSLTSTGAEHKLANQAVDYDTSVAAPTSYDYLNFSPDAATTGGTSGDVLHITAMDAKAWHVVAQLTTTNATPSSCATIGAS